MSPTNLTPIKYIFLLPGSPGERLAEDGVLKELADFQIDAEIWTFCRCTAKEAQAFAGRLIACHPDAVVYPRFHSEIFLWERASQDWFFGWSDGEPILQDNSSHGLVGITGILTALEHKGIPALDVIMSYGGPFGDEITVYHSLLPRLHELRQGKQPDR